MGRGDSPFRCGCQRRCGNKECATASLADGSSAGAVSLFKETRWAGPVNSGQGDDTLPASVRAGSRSSQADPRPPNEGRRVGSHARLAHEMHGHVVDLNLILLVGIHGGFRLTPVKASGFATWKVRSSIVSGP